MITISIDTRDISRALNDFQRKQLPFALSVALNETAKEVQADLHKSTGVFDRPRPATQKATVLTRSTKRDLTAQVALKSRVAGGLPANEYLQAEIQGGARPDKRSEILLKRAGVLPLDMQARPGSGARLDAYGNMSRGQIVQIISFFRAFGGIATSGRARGRKGTTTASQKLNRSAGPKRPRKPIEYFVVPEGQPGLATGVWQRKGKAISPVLIFIARPAYRPIYKFESIARAAVRRDFNRNLDSAFKRAIATAR